MQVLRVGRGYYATWRVQLRYAADHPTLARQPVVGVYSGSETLDLVVADDDGDALTLEDSAAEWRGLDGDAEVTGAEAAALGLITIEFDDSDSAGLGPRFRRLSVRMVAGGEPVEVLAASLKVEARP